jgi:hypothetical protein
MISNSFLFKWKYLEESRICKTFLEGPVSITKVEVTFLNQNN